MAWIPAMQTGDTFSTKGAAFINQMITFVNDMKKIPYEMEWHWQVLVSHGDTYTNLDTHQTGDNIQDDFGMGNLHSRLHFYMDRKSCFRNEIAEGAHMETDLTSFYQGYIDRINAYLAADSLVDSSQYIDTAKFSDSQASGGIIPIFRDVPDTSYDSVENYNRIQGPGSTPIGRSPYLSKTTLNQTQALCKVLQDCVGFWLTNSYDGAYGSPGDYKIPDAKSSYGSVSTPSADSRSGAYSDKDTTCAYRVSQASADWDTNSWVSATGKVPFVREEIDNDSSVTAGKYMRYKNLRGAWRFGVDIADTYQYPLPTSDKCKTFTFSPGGQDLINIGDAYTVHTGTIDTHANTTGVILTDTFMDRTYAGADTNGTSCSDTVANKFQHMKGVVVLWDTFADPDSGI
jgi:hypothetical protein